MLLGEIKDPRVALVTITKVKVTDDLRQAQVNFSIFGESDDKDDALQGLQSASGFIKRMLAQRVRLRRIPELRFCYDSSLEYGNRIEQLIEKGKHGA